jgi:hypothetical protein
MRIAPSVENSTQPLARVQPAEKVEPHQEEKPHIGAPAQGFISPVINVDTQSGVAVLQFRDDMSGEVTAQFPSETVVKKYREGEAIAHGNPPPAKGGPEPSSAQTAQTAEVQAQGGEASQGGETAVAATSSGSDTAKS